MPGKQRTWYMRPSFRSRTSGKPVPWLMLPDGSPHPVHRLGAFEWVGGAGCAKLLSITVASKLSVVRASGSGNSCEAVSVYALILAVLMKLCYTLGKI